MVLPKPSASLPADMVPLLFAPLSRPDFYSLCLVCRAMRALAEPYLYSNIHFSWEIESRPPPLPAIVRTILERPELGDHVRSLIVDGHIFLYAFRRPRRPPKLPAAEGDLAGWAAFIERVQMPYHQLWTATITKGMVDAFVAVLLFHSPKLHTLQLGTNTSMDSKLYGLLLHSALSNGPDSGHLPRHFSQLRQVTLLGNHSDDDPTERDAQNTSNYLLLFYLPAVQQLWLAIDNPRNGDFQWPFNYPPAALGLTSLRLEILREKHLARILSVTPNLESLAWQWFCCDDVRDQTLTNVVDFDQIVQDLSVVKGTLCDLKITASAQDSYSDPNYPNVTFRGTLRGLAGFPALKRLQLPLPFLFASMSTCTVDIAGILPSGLETLKISGDLYLYEEWVLNRDTVLPPLSQWLMDCRRHTPHLRTITLEHEGEWGSEACEQLKMLCGRVGVGFDVVLLD